MTYSEVRQRAVEKPSVHSSTASSQSSIDEAVDRVPCNPPPFTIGDLRRAIPAHCFNRSFLRSFSYVIIDLLLAAALAFAATKIDVFINTDYMPFLINRPSLLFFLRTAVWTAYWACQGAVLTGVWVIGHECGHGAFSSVDLISDIVGFILHTALLVPYFPWKISHRKHHSNTGNLDKDEVFVPGFLAKEGVERRIKLLEKKRARRLRAKLEKEANNNNNDAEDLYEIDPDKTPIQWFFDSVHRLFSITRMLTLGWPAYLIANATSHPHYPNGTNHFSPFSKIFTERERPLVVLSDIGLIGMIALLVQAVKLFGFANVIFYYFIPYLIVNGYLVLITFLQHTDAVLPHYSGKEWDWLRGALATIDRDYSILNIFHHHIGDTHISHHLFSYIPHYHAQEATEAIKKVLGDYYRKDDTPIPIALWKQFGYCEGLIEDEGKKGVFWF